MQVILKINFILQVKIFFLYLCEMTKMIKDGY